ncbi:MAG: cystathionine gamma-synthase [Gammaproteobacteria bacterium]|nr:MAG: cystathionine gamma-synthase [Gammaproteobacteria bacterium]
MKKELNTSNLEFSTRCVHSGVYKDELYNSVVTPIYPSSTFYFEGPGQTSGYDYTRTRNPTRVALEENLTSLEGGAGCTATSTGMSAISSALHLLPENAHIIAGNEIYGGTFRLFNDIMPNRAMSVSQVDMRNLDAVRSAIRPETKAIWIETPSNPLLNLTDIKAVCGLAREHDLLTIADNTFLTPYLQRPLELGVDLVVHSTTKYLNGHSDVVGGAVIAATPELAEQVAAMCNALGTTCSPYDAWLVLRGVKTLSLRMRAHEENGMALAQFLDQREEVERVYYPGLQKHPDHALACRQQSGFGGMLSFDMKGGEDRAQAFIAQLHLYSFAESLGGVESLIEHPASMSHAAMTPAGLVAAGISPGTIRVSAGIEASSDLITDMEQAFATIS